MGSRPGFVQSSIEIPSQQELETSKDVFRSAAKQRAVDTSANANSTSVPKCGSALGKEFQPTMARIHGKAATNPDISARASREQGEQPFVKRTLAIRGRAVVKSPEGTSLSDKGAEGCPRRNLPDRVTYSQEASPVKGRTTALRISHGSQLRDILQRLQQMEDISKQKGNVSSPPSPPSDDQTPLESVGDDQPSWGGSQGNLKTIRCRPKSPW